MNYVVFKSSILSDNEVLKIFCIIPSNHGINIYQVYVEL